MMHFENNFFQIREKHLIEFFTEFPVTQSVVNLNLTTKKRKLIHFAISFAKNSA